MNVNDPVASGLLVAQWVQWLVPVMLLFSVWTLSWKGYALWKAARRNSVGMQKVYINRKTCDEL